MLLVAVGCAAAQIVIPQSRIPRSLQSFTLVPGEKTLQCEVSPLHPALNFGFRFQAGYLVRVPMSQYEGPRHYWAMLLRITPEGGSPTYLGSRMRLPDVPRTKVAMEVGGGYLLGEGKYKVAWGLYDDTGRVCRKEWSIDTKPG